MSVELEEIQGFLAAHAPFASLPAEELAALPATMTMRYVRRGETIVEHGQPNDFCYCIRSGAVDVTDENDTLLDRRDAGRCFGYSTLMGDNSSRYRMVAVEDSLLMLIPRGPFLELAGKYPDLARFFSSQSKRMRAAAEELRTDSSSDILRMKLGEFMITTPVTVPATSTIQEAARFMQENNVSSLLIMDGTRVSGIVTDRDLRKKVVAIARDVTEPISEIMTPDPRTLPSDAQAFEAMMLMTELGIHHLPVVDRERLVGIVSTPDIMRLLRNDPIYVTADLGRATTTEEMRKTYSSVSDVAARFIDRGASSEDVASLVTVSADSLARRLLALGEEKFGPAPVEYAFVVLGSQGRREMGLASDQDNALVLSNDYNESEHGEYFANLSEYVCRGLDAAGQVLCPGDMMAMNPQWRMTQDQWLDTFRLWITAPEPDALLHAQTFFDMRGIHGATHLASAMHTAAVDSSKDAGRMHAHLATLAARREPPLGFFRGFVVDRSGEYANTLDIKKGGTAAIVQMARLFALSSGVAAVGTRQRLKESAGAGKVSEKGAQDLIDAFDFLNSTALKQQAVSIHKKEKPTYHIDPSTLGKLDREHLRDAFQIIKSMQNALATKYPIRNI